MVSIGSGPGPGLLEHWKSGPGPGPGLPDLDPAHLWHWSIARQPPKRKTAEVDGIIYMPRKERLLWEKQLQETENVDKSMADLCWTSRGLQLDPTKEEGRQHYAREGEVKKIKGRPLVTIVLAKATRTMIVPLL